MSKTGKIVYTKVDFTDVHVQQKYKFPAVIILHDLNSVIQKITIYDELGLKSIFDFTQYATKDFVNQAISAALSNLQDNRLEFPNYEAFPVIGDESKFYIDLTEDKIYIWDATSGTYKNQSWDTTIISEINLQIANLQSTKLDTGVFNDAVADIAAEQNQQNDDIGNLQLDKQDKLATISGNVGVGKSDASATEKLDISGRTKADGIILNETTTAILPKEIKFKGGKFKGAKADGIERAFLMEGDASDNLIVEYTHSGNREIYPTAVDYATGYVTAANHGFTNTTPLMVGLFSTSFVNGVFSQNLQTVIPLEWLQAVIYVVKIDANTLKICDASGNVIAVNPTSVANNGKLDITKWHIEDFVAYKTPLLPTGMKRVSIVIRGFCTVSSRVFATARYVMLKFYGTNNVEYNNQFNTSANLPSSNNKTNVKFIQKTDFIATDIDLGLVTQMESCFTCGGGVPFYVAATTTTPGFGGFAANNGISSIDSPADRTNICNGTKISFYKI